MTMQRFRVRPWQPRLLLFPCLLLAALCAALSAPTRTTAQGDPAVVGQWGAVQAWPIVAVHSHLLPTGKVLFFAYSDGIRQWDPATGAVTTLPNAGYNVFCTGHSFLADGRLFLSGGHIANNVGLPDASAYNPFTNTWQKFANMNAGRWYPSNTTLANGDQLVHSGDADVGVNNDLPQVFEAATGSWRDLTSARLAMTLYPRTFLAPNGQVFFATQTSRYLNTSGTGAWATVGSQRTGGRENYGSAVMYEPGKVLYAGGADPPTATAETIDLNASTPAWALTGSMPQARRQLNVTVLPDGKVLATGGSASSGFNTDDGGNKPAYLWDPATGSWSTMAAEQDYRGYHSTALLLPDGRVLSAGGDNHPNAQVFSPPYLFNGARPTISSAPGSAGYGSTFFVGTPDAASISRVSLIAPGSVTHAQNWHQRFVPLSFTQASGGLNVTVPASANTAPPGYYMLFLVNSTGVPSVASWVRVSNAAASPPAAPSSLTATAVSTSQINLSWTDNATNEDGVKIERSADGITFTQVATTGPDATTFADTGRSGGTAYWYRVRAFNTAGDSAYSNTASATTPTPGTGTGLKGEYFDNMDFTLLKVTRTDATVNFDWGTGSPDASIGVDTFSTRWTGQVQPLFSETYTFYTTTDDGVRLWVNGQLILDKWIDQAPTEWASASIALTAGQKYDVRMDFYENGGGAVARLAWASATQAKEIIPQSQLYPPAAASPPAAPSNLTATAVSRTQINLAWTDNSADETGFKIERSRDNATWAQIATTAAGVRTYSNTGLRKNTLYYYRVRATNANGDSAYSNTASARTLR